MTHPNEAPLRSIVVGTAGHIDHGKTMLVRALTGIDTDRLPEEKRRGITIDLGFASCDLRSSSAGLTRMDIIDVPGHKQFIRNMLAGAGGIDLAMLVISAAQGVMPQTEEHLAICQLLGITRGLVVLTKCDLVTEEGLASVRRHVHDALRTSFLGDAPVVPVSIRSGLGLPALREELAALSARVPPRDPCGLPRLPLDRAFVIKGFGTVVTGTLQSGVLTAGEMLTLEPGGREVRVRGLQRGGRTHGEAPAGSRVALNLSGIEVGEVRRGATLVRPRTLQAVDVIDAEVSLLAGAPELAHRARVKLHSFTSDTVTTVSVYGYRTIAAGGAAIVRLKLARPVVLVPGDRFVLRRLSPAQTIGGGRVLDAWPTARTPKKKALAWLESIRNASPAEQLEARVVRSGVAGISLLQLSRELGWSVEAVQQTARPALDLGAIRLLAHKLLITGSALEEAAGAMLKIVTGSPAPASAHPAGIRRSELRSRSRLAVDVFDAVLEMLAGSGRLCVSGEAGHELVLPPGAKPNAADPNGVRLTALAELYRRAALHPPAFPDVLRELRLSEKDARAYVTTLLREKTLIKIAAADVFMHRLAVEALETSIRELRNQTLDVGRLKEMTGLSRKYAIPLLEHLDRQRITRRQGDTRVVL